MSLRVVRLPLRVGEPLRTFTLPVSSPSKPGVLCWCVGAEEEQDREQGAQHTAQHGVTGSGVSVSVSLGWLLRCVPQGILNARALWVKSDCVDPLAANLC